MQQIGLFEKPGSNLTMQYDKSSVYVKCMCRFGLFASTLALLLVADVECMYHGWFTIRWQYLV
jgi:hypothetical protein